MIGFDDHAAAEFMDLSTIRQPVAAQGSAIARAILAAVGGGPPGGEVDDHDDRTDRARIDRPGASTWYAADAP